MPYDVFVSYARSDDECPKGAEFGWVTTFQGRAQKAATEEDWWSGGRHLDGSPVNVE